MIVDFTNIEHTYEMIDNWYKFIQEKLHPDNRGIVKDGFLDLVFENTFYNKETNQYIFFDQEWYEKNVPIKYILYRAISNFYEHNLRINEKLKQEELYKKYNISNS